MDAIATELTKLEALSNSSPSTSTSKKSKSSSKSSSTATGSSSSINTTLDALLASLETAQAKLANGNVRTCNVLRELKGDVAGAKAKVDESIKTYHKAIAKVGTAIDKALPLAPTAPAVAPVYYTSPESSAHLDKAIVTALLRRGESDTVRQESLRKVLSEEEVERTLNLASRLDSIVRALEKGDNQPAIDWASFQTAHLATRSSPLLYYLHRSVYLSMLLSQSTSSQTQITQLAITYARTHLTPHFPTRSTEIQRLFSAILFLPLPNPTSDLSYTTSHPYADLASPSLHAPLLVPTFTKEFCALVGWPERESLGLAVEVGANGSAAKVEKGLKVMKDKLGAEWKVGEELPVDIPLPTSLRFHSVFTCPVSKQQTTASNPPMRLLCGHTVSQESLTKLAKGPVHRVLPRTVKCPYCPVETASTAALELHF